MSTFIAFILVVGVVTGITGWIGAISAHIKIEDLKRRITVLELAGADPKKSGERHG